MFIEESSRTLAVRRAAQKWQSDLVDTSGRNRLRRFRDLRAGTLDLTPGQADGLDQRALNRLLSGRQVNLGDLIHELVRPSNALPAIDDARRRLRTIHKTDLTNREEKGIDTCFALVGLATWEVEQGSAPNAPVILLPLDIEATGAAARDFNLRISGDPHLNPVLTHMLRVEYDIDTEVDEADLAEAPPTSFPEFCSLLERLEKIWSALPALAIEPRAVVANFSYSTMPLVAELETHSQMLAGNELVAAIAGDESARESLRSKICDPDPGQPDFDKPADEFLVLDADSSQHVAINRVLGGESLVIQGPPGTGKSQTIVNLIACLIARGKRVLFVAEKRAAIDAVMKRIEEAGLSELVMDMHGRPQSRRNFARSLAESLKQVSRIPPHDYSNLHTRLQHLRDELVAHKAAMHDKRDPCDLSVYEMRVRLLAIPEDAHTNQRLSREAAANLGAGGFADLAVEVREWVDLGGHEFDEVHPDLHRSSITDSEQARTAFDLVSRINVHTYPNAHGAFADLTAELGIELPRSVDEWNSLADYLARVNSTMVRCRREVFAENLDDLEKSLSWARSPVTHVLARAISKRYASALESAKSLVDSPEDLSATDVFRLISAASGHAREWEQRCLEGRPRVPSDLDDAREKAAALERELAELSEFGLMDDAAGRPYEAVAASVQRVASNPSAIANLPRVRELEDRFRSLGVADVLGRVGKEISPELAAPALEHAWISRVLDDLEFDDRRLSAFDRDGHDRSMAEFAESDLEHLETTTHRINRIAAEGIVAAMNEHPEEEALVRREAAKKRRHLSARNLISRAPNVIAALRPCWTMSPVLVAEMVPPGLDMFDVVIFDEASQIPPAEAITSIARAPQLVVAGDSRQLPPTTFFGRETPVDENDDEEENAVALTADIESLLDAADALLRDTMLLWHYRSRDDRLIAFSNHHIYGGTLTAFPGSMVKCPIDHHLIPFRPITGATGNRSNPDEVGKVVELVIRHAHGSPDETLGVIAFGQRHADNIENELFRQLGALNDPSLDAFFAETREERFFVKNIERVQGDERDSIILSVGYHKSPDGRLPYRFGPLLQEGGERRLNVAVTRARSRLALVSSFGHRDMDPRRSSARGVKLLRQYLEYADSEATNLGSEATREPLNPFELAIRDGLESRGIPVTPQLGVSGYRIDFACAHPDRPGQMVLAIEADGASYHSTPTARDRDRLRQQVLEDKNWKFHRIWSTAWFRDKSSELDKAEAAWKEAVQSADRSGRVRRRRKPSRAARDRTITVVPKRSPRPNVIRRGTYGFTSITDYSSEQLVELANWIKSDSLLRTDEELMREMMSELGFKRTGSRIQAALTAAIRKAES